MFVCLCLVVSIAFPCFSSGSFPWGHLYLFWFFYEKLKLQANLLQNSIHCFNNTSFFLVNYLLLRGTYKSQNGGSSLSSIIDGYLLVRNQFLEICFALFCVLHIRCYSVVLYLSRAANLPIKKRTLFQTIVYIIYYIVDFLNKVNFGEFKVSYTSCLILVQNHWLQKSVMMYILFPLFPFFCKDCTCI